MTEDETRTGANAPPTRAERARPPLLDSRRALRPREAAEAGMAKPPSDPRVRAFCEALAEMLADLVLRDFEGCEISVDSEPCPGE